MMKRILLGTVLSVFLVVAKGQTTYSWASYPTKCSGASVYTQPNMTVSVSGSGFANTGPQGPASSCASSAANRYFSPKYVVTGNASAPDWQQTGLGIGVNWSNIISSPPSSTVDVVFTDPVCTPLNFSIYDINSGTCCGVSVIWKDIVSISAVDGLGNTIYPLAANVTPMTGGNSYNAATGTITAGNYGATNSVTNISFPAAQVAAIKSLKIVYKSGTITNDPYTLSGTDPDPQYIIISNITASSPTVTVSASAIPCGSTTTTLSSTTNAVAPTYAWTGSAGTSITSPTAASTSVTGAGTYTLTVTSGGAGGCTASTVYTVTASGSAPNLVMGSDQVISCSSTTATVSASSSTSGVTYAWTGPGTITPNNAASGTVTTPGVYSVTVTQTATGCTNSNIITVTSNTTTPNITMGANQTINCGSSSATISGSSSTGGVTYSWSGPGVVTPNNASSGSVSTAGSYTLTVTNPANGCSNTGIVSVTANNSVPNISVGAAQSITCSSSTATVSGSSSTSGVTYAWTGPGAITPNNAASGSVSASGVYTLTVTNPSNGCSSVGTVSVSNNTTVPSLTMGSGASVTCSNSTPTISGSTNVSGATYSWSGPGLVTPNNASSGIVSSTGTYTLTVTDPSNGCSNTGQVTVTENLNSPSLVIGANQSITCSSAIATIDGTTFVSGAIYAWSGPGTISPNNASSGTVTVPGTYILTVTNPANGCSSTASLDVIDNTLTPQLTMGSNQVINCSSSSATISGMSATSGVSYSWAGPGAVSPSNASSGIVSIAGTYSLTVNDPSNGCSTTGTIDVSNNSAAPSITMGSNQTIDCATTVATIDGSTLTTGVTYSWSGPGTITPNNASSGTVSVAGTYTLTVADPSNGCSATGTVDVINNSSAPVITMASAQTLDCITGTAIVSGATNTSGVNYAWTGPGAVTPATSDSGIVSVAGTYTLTVTDPSNNCSSTANIDVLPSTSPNQPTISANGPTSLCSGDSLVLTSSSNSNNVWSTGDTTSTIVVHTAGSYSVTVTNAAGCSSVSVATQVTLQSLPTVSATSSASAICAGGNVTLNGTGAVTYVWTGGVNDGIPFTINTTQTYTVTGTDGNGCSDTAVVSVNVNPLPIINANASSTSVCEGNTVTLNGSGLGLGGNYTWSNGALDNVPFVPAATTTYTVTGTDVNGCSNTANVLVAVNNLPAAPVISTVGSGNTVCAGQNITLTASPSSGITWQPGGQTTSTIMVSNSGTYTAFITDNNACVSANGSITVTVNPVPIVDVTNLVIDTATCSLQNGGLSNVSVNGGTAPYTYQWFNSATNTVVGNNTSLNNISSGSYYLVATDANGCSDSTSGIVLPTVGGVHVNLTGTPLVGYDPLDVVLNATTDVPVSSYAWYLGSNLLGTTAVNSFTVNGITYGNYTAAVIVADQYGCLDTAEVTIVVDTDVEIVIPNVFTPNGDQINDVFEIEMKGIKTIEAQIFNRWGQKIYSWSSLNGTWDGKMSNGEFASEGTYYFIIDFTDVNNVKYNRSGYFLLAK